MLNRELLDDLFYEFSEFFSFIERERASVFVPYKYTAAAVKETYRCLVIKALNLEVSQMLSMPPILDQIWHEMILCTDEYALLCESLVKERDEGKLVPHTTRTESDPIGVKNDRVAAMRVMYEQLWGEPATPYLWVYENEEQLDENSKPPIWQIFVKMLDGVTKTLDATPALPLYHLKLLVQNTNTALAPGKQRLIFAGNQLVDNKTLAEQNVTKLSMVHLMLRLAGC